MIDDPEAAAAALAARGAIAVRVLTGSMAPLVEAGERVLVEARPAVLGDVVLLRARGGLVLHRLVGRLGWARWVHAGETGGAGLVRRDDVLGVARVPRRVPPRLERLTRAAEAALRGLLAWGSRTAV